MVAPITSAAGVVALLDEPEPELQTYALQKLDSIVGSFWAEIADSITKIEILYENPRFPDRELAALVASKVFFHLGEENEALSFALGAGKLFDVDKKDEYTDTVISKAIDQYIDATAAKDSKADPRLASIVEQMFARCIADKEYRQALGIALETKRLDIIEEIFNVTRDQTLLSYVLEAVMGVVQTLDVRNQVLHLLVKLFKSLPSPDNFSIAQCYVYLNAPQLASELLHDLVQKAHTDASASSSANTENDPLLVAYQVAFDLAESATQEFLENVRTKLLETTTGKEQPAKTGDNGDVDMAGTGSSDEPQQSTADSCITRIRSILLGEESIQLYLDFLQRSNHADLTILKATKDALDARSSVYHNAMTFANAYMNAGTTSDSFLRENLDWLAKASNWSKFTATAALGVINKGNLKEGLTMLRPYLPHDGVSSSVYSEGGSLFALGLIHANHGKEVMELLTTTLRNNPAEIVQHGAALGLGAAGMATGNDEVYEELRNVLYTDSAVAGEASGYAMGLVMLGTASEKAVEEMLTYAHETQHEKIIRGLAIGLALLFYGREEEADVMVDRLMSDKDPILRYGGIYTIALAYAGTGNNKAIRRLLHVAVSDVNDDVRRAAVTSLGFLLFRNPTQVPRIVQLLSESYNPHVRYGSTLALGISCASTGLDEAVNLLEPMMKDPVDFVRQGASIALSMILIQQNETLNPRVASVRAAFEKTLNDKHEDAMAKFGAALAQGLIDAGGRNVTIGLQSRGGSANMPAIVGMALFTQFWYWFPMAHFASLAFTPTALIGLDRELRIPAFEFRSNVRPSFFAYPQPAKKESEKKVEKVETAVLSTTAKAQQRQRVKEREKAREDRGDSMEVDDVKKPEAAKEDGEEKAGDKETKKPKRERKPAEPSFSLVPNLSRVVPAELKYVDFPPESRYLPIRPVLGAGGGQLHDVFNTSTVASKGKLGILGTASPIPGGSGRVTPGIQIGGAKQQQPIKIAAPTSASTSAATGQSAGPSAESARSISSSSIGGGGGILLLMDRKPEDKFESIRLDSGNAGGATNDAAGASSSLNDPRAPNTDEMSPEDLAAVQAALMADDEELQNEKDETTGVNPNSRRDGQGDGNNGPGGTGAPEAR